MIIQILVIAVILGLLNAFRGSGWLQQHGYTLAATLLKWVIIPIAVIGAVLYVHGPITLAVVATLPYYLLMATGTGACIQACIYNAPPTSNHGGWAPIVTVCNKITAAIFKGLTPPAYFYAWGFFYATCISIIFAVPIALANPIYAIPMLFWGVGCRYIAVWRKNEFLLMSVFTGLLMLAIVSLS